MALRREFTVAMIEADYPGQIARREGALIEYLEPELARRKSTLDHAQAAALDRLQQLADELTAFRSARESTLRRLFAPPDVPRGVYLWGGVGRGKTFLMDSFYASVGVRRKTRVHFHAFMRDVHAELATVNHEADLPYPRRPGIRGGACTRIRRDGNGIGRGSQYCGRRANADGKAPGGKRRVVRFRNALRRSALATRLSRACAAIRGDFAIRHS